jgi:hypothetical protein
MDNMIERAQAEAINSEAHLRFAFLDLSDLTGCELIPGRLDAELANTNLECEFILAHVPGTQSILLALAHKKTCYDQKREQVREWIKLIKGE